jgi:hypothetical protein
MNIGIMQVYRNRYMKGTEIIGTFFGRQSCRRISGSGKVKTNSKKSGCEDKKFFIFTVSIHFLSCYVYLVISVRTCS